MSEEEGGIERLIKFQTYKAVCIGLGTRCSKEDSKPNPDLRILADSSKEPWESPYFGYMVYSTNRDTAKKEISNNVREELINNPFSNMEVFCRVIGIPLKNPKGPYFVVGAQSLEEKSELQTSDRLEGRSYMTPEEAFAVIKEGGENIFYAYYLFKSKENGYGGGRDPALRIWKNYGENGFGFLQPVKRIKGWGSTAKQEARKFAEWKITYDMIYGSIKYGSAPVLKEGDRLVVRKIGQNPTGNTFFFEPVVNFMEEDEAYSPEGKQLTTTLTGYDRGGIICNVPILSSQKGKKEGDAWIGKGYIPRSEKEREIDHFFYKPTIVFNLEQGDTGKYVDARITKNDEKTIFAQKIAL